MVSHWVKSGILPSPINHHKHRHLARNAPHWGAAEAAEPPEAINATIVGKYIKVKVEYGSIISNVMKCRNTVAVVAATMH
jgi:hypothetical protein